MIIDSFGYSFLLKALTIQATLLTCYLEHRPTLETQDEQPLTIHTLGLQAHTWKRWRSSAATPETCLTAAHSSDLPQGVGVEGLRWGVKKLELRI